MEKLKYIMFDEVFPLIFTTAINHNDIYVEGMKPTSAGFVKLTGGITVEENSIIEARVFGESISLDIGIKEKDSEIIKRFLNNNIL